jgi:hypothetical protein
MWPSINLLEDELKAGKEGFTHVKDWRFLRKTTLMYLMLLVKMRLV